MEQSMNYFTALHHECELLTQKGQEYLDSLPPLEGEDEETVVSRNEIAERIYQKAFELYGDDEEGEDMPEWAMEALDGFVPYSGMPRNGSLFFSMGFSIIAQEALQRNLLEYVEGRTDTLLDFSPVVSKDFYDKYKEEEPKKKGKKQ